MAKLVLSLDGVVVQQSFVDQGCLRIGRSPDNDMAVDDPLLSREHATILTVGEDHIIEDRGSSNGTFVNGRRVVRQILQHRDVIELGAYRLCYLNARMASDVELERTMLIAALPRNHATENVPEAVADIPVARPGKLRFPQGRVRVLDGPDARTPPDVAALDRVVTTFGTPGEQLVVIVRRPSGFNVIHVEGARYPRVNGVSIGNGPRLLSQGDMIEAAGYRLEFELDPPRESSDRQ